MTITDAELVSLTHSYGGESEVGWWDRIRGFSLGWVAARLANGEAAGFVNVAWDGCDHTFLIDTKVRSDLQHRGIGTELVRIATDARAAGRLRMAPCRLPRGAGTVLTSARAASNRRAAALVHLPDLRSTP